jgi:hypothetical protein
VVPSLSPAGGLETFDTTPPGSLPAGWSQWSRDGSSAFAVSAARALSGPNGLAVTAGLSNLAARSWLNAPLPADLQVSADVYLGTLIPAQLFARGSGLDGSTPSYYALSLSRGLQAQILRVAGGAATALGGVTSAGYFSGRWVQATLSLQGTTLQAQVYRPDSGQYLNAQGQWQSAPAWALQVTDGAITGPGQVGLARPASYTGTVAFDDFGVALPAVTEHFDQSAAGSLPAGWAQWSSTSDTPFAVAAGPAVSAPNRLTAAPLSSRTAARAWPTSYSGTDLQAGAAVYLDSLIPAQVFARGTNLNTATPSYYAVAVTRGLQAQLVRVQDGAATVLGQVTSADWVSNTWVRATLYAGGTELRAQVFRLDTGQFLTAAGAWQAQPTWALDLTDTALTGPGQAGLALPASYAGQVAFDDFAVTAAAGDTLPPTVTITSPAPGGGPLSGTVTVHATATDNVGVVRVQFGADGAFRTTATTGPYQWTLDTTTVSNGTHTIDVLAYDATGNAARASVVVTVQNANALPQPVIPQHLPNIRLAELAYQGTPVDATMSALLRNDVDLVVSDPAELSQVAALAPQTPQLLYTNLSTLYGSLLTDWDAYADAHGLSRESVFYHVTSATPYSGTSPSSQPVDWFWSVALGQGASWTDLTGAARRTNPGGVTFGGVGQSVVVGYPEPFREINVALLSGPRGGWRAALEYPTQVDAAGNPTAWAPLPLLTDTTAGLGRTGQVLFDPPADWKPASVSGSARLYYVRFRTTAAGTAPTAADVLGDDYTGAGNGTSGVIPGFDYAADANHDGYLSDAEYARAAPGLTARFAYQGRALYGSYGEMRFATDPSSPDLRSWSVDYFTRLLAQQPSAAGLFVDNSADLAPVTAAGVVEPVSSYANDYATLLNAVAQAVAPHWLLANTAGGGTAADAVVGRNTAYYEEFGLRPLSGSWKQFEDTAALVAHRAALQSPPPYAVLDALPTGGSPTDPRTQIATLAEYYLLADPNRTFLDPFGGYEPATSWSRHFFGALSYDVGRPTGGWIVMAGGTDPADSSKSYRVYERPYSNALVLYKPLSSNANGSATGSAADSTATTHPLPGTYRAVQADGSLGPPITSISLRNGEGAILVPA